MEFMGPPIEWRKISIEDLKAILDLLTRQRDIDNLSPAARNLEQRDIDKSIERIRKTHLNA